MKVTVPLQDLDPDTSKEVVIDIEQKHRSLSISPRDYGDKTSQDGNGTPIMLEVYKGKLRLLVWDDINQEDPSHVIDMEGARETERENT
jgi:hypothetical protein